MFFCLCPPSKTQLLDLTELQEKICVFKTWGVFAARDLLSNSFNVSHISSKTISLFLLILSTWVKRHLGSRNQWGSVVKEFYVIFGLNYNKL